MLVRALIAGVIAGVVGAVVWTLISYFANAELGIIAWGIGALVGVAVAVACQDEADSMTGGVAAIIAIVAILGGKWGAVHMSVGQFTSQMQSTVIASIDDDAAKLHIASELTTERIGAGKALKWPEGKDADSAETLTDYPKEIVTDVTARWKAMEPAAQESFKEDLRRSMSAELKAFASSIEGSAFKDSFSGYDVLWFILALLSAFRIGSGNGGSDD